MKYNLAIGAALVISLGGGIWAWKTHKASVLQQSEMSAAKSEIEELNRLRTEMLDLYNQRLELVKNAIKATPEMEAAAKGLKLDTAADFERFDMFQNQISEKVSTSLTQGGKLPEGLSKLEESLNRTRKAYHQKAFAISQRVQKSKLPLPPPMVFAAEKLLHEAGKF